MVLTCGSIRSSECHSHRWRRRGSGGTSRPAAVGRRKRRRRVGGWELSFEGERGGVWREREQPWRFWILRQGIGRGGGGGRFGRGSSRRR